MNYRSAVLLAGLLFVSCGASSDGTPTSVNTGGNNSGGNNNNGGGTNTVTMVGNSFSPSTITVTKGSSVTWSNTSGTSHNVIFDDVNGAPSPIQEFSSGTRSATFLQAGTFPYACTLHAGMIGSVIVQ